MNAHLRILHKVSIPADRVTSVPLGLIVNERDDLRESLYELIVRRKVVSLVYAYHVRVANTPTRRKTARQHPAPQRQGADPQRSTNALRIFAMTVPGMAPLLCRELRDTLGLEFSDSGFDGRADLVLFDVPRGGRSDVRGLRTAEDVFVEVGRTCRSEGDKAHWIAGRIWRPERVQRALSVWAEYVRPLAGAMSYRVVVRVLQEQSFLRTELRRQVTRVIGNDRPKWKVADPAQIEVWITEYAPGKILAGLRLSTGAMRQHEGRASERSGALRPAVASAMVQLAGEADGVLLDPCCGSGTILREARAEGWQARGFDIDAEAVEIAQHNVPDTPIEQGDTRTLHLPDASVGACVSNLPFGEQYKVPGDPAEWLRTVLGQMARVTRPGGHVVVLCSTIPRQSVPAELVLGHREQIRLLGLKTTLWDFRRV